MSTNRTQVLAALTRTLLGCRLASLRRRAFTRTATYGPQPVARTVAVRATISRVRAARRTGVTADETSAATTGDGTGTSTDQSEGVTHVSENASTRAVTMTVTATVRVGTGAARQKAVAVAVEVVVATAAETSLRANSGTTTKRKGVAATGQSTAATVTSTSTSTSDPRTRGADTNDGQLQCVCRDSEERLVPWQSHHDVTNLKPS